MDISSEMTWDKMVPIRRVGDQISDILSDDVILANLLKSVHYQEDSREHPSSVVK